MSSIVSLMTPELVTAVSMPERGSEPPLIAVVLTAPKGSRVYETRIFEINSRSGAGVCRWRSPAIGRIRRDFAHTEAVNDLRRLGRDLWRAKTRDDG